MNAYAMQPIRGSLDMSPNLIMTLCLLCDYAYEAGRPGESVLGSVMCIAAGVGTSVQSHSAFVKAGSGMFSTAVEVPVLPGTAGELSGAFGS